jgi:hypothetical protein
MSTFTVPSGRRRSVCLGVALGGEEDLLAAIHRLVERGDRALASDEELRDHVRKDDDVSQRQQGCDPALRCGLATITVVLEEHPTSFCCPRDRSVDEGLRADAHGAREGMTGR